MDTIVHGNEIPNILCEQQYIGVGDHYCGDVYTVALYVIGMYKTTLVAIHYGNI